MRITVVCRTRNEERNIERFCKTYQWADNILIADGGSEDETVSIAGRFKNVKVRPFQERVYGKNGLWRNPQGKHMNFMFRWAEEIDSDWIIFDDCDSVPTLSFQKDGRRIFDGCKKDYLFLKRLYVYGEHQYFPKMTTGHFIYAWRSSVKIRADESDPWKHSIHVPEDDQRKSMEFPYGVLHYFAQDNEHIQRKMKFYLGIGQHPDLQHPLKIGGELKHLPEWAVYE